MQSDLLVTLRVLLLMAIRNVWRNPRRTFLTLSAIAVGLGSVLLLASLARGLQESMVEQAIRRLTGHIQIHAPGYVDDPTVENSFVLDSRFMKSELKAFGVERSALRIKVPAVVMSERESLGITLVGIDPEEEKGLSFIGDDVVRGRHLESSSDKGLIIGAKLASRLQTRVGKRVVILATDKQNKIADRGFKVVGVYEDALEATEMQFVFVGRLVAQQMLKMKGQASEASLLFEDQDNLEGPLSRISENFADLDVADWKTLQPLARIVTEVQNGFLWIWFLVVIVAVGFSLVNTLFMAIFERIREIGLLLALGMRPGYIVVQVMFESWFILLIALVAGNSMGILGVCWLSGGIDLSSFSAGAEMAQFGRVFYPTLWSSDLVMANFLLLIVCSVASLYPAIKASRYIPVEAITRA